MKALNDLKDMLCDELNEIVGKGELTAGSLDTVDKLTHSIKSIDSILMCENNGYSQGYPHRYEPRRGYSYRYSRKSGKEAIVDELEDILDKASTEDIKNAIRSCIKEIR